MTTPNTTGAQALSDTDLRRIHQRVTGANRFDQSTLMLMREVEHAVNEKHAAALPIDFKQATDQGASPLIARALAEWNEDDGPVMWWAWCGHDWAGEPAFCGTPNDSDWPGYHTHWTVHPAAPTLQGVADGDAVGGKSGGASNG
jgi:hypothetical protein